MTSEAAKIQSNQTRHPQIFIKKSKRSQRTSNGLSPPPPEMIFIPQSIFYVLYSNSFILHTRSPCRYSTRSLVRISICKQQWKNRTRKKKKHKKRKDKILINNYVTRKHHCQCIRPSTDALVNYIRLYYSILSFKRCFGIWKTKNSILLDSQIDFVNSCALCITITLFVMFCIEIRFNWFYQMPK